MLLYSFDIGYNSSQSFTAPLLGEHEVSFSNPHGAIDSWSHSWGAGFKASGGIGIKANIRIGIRTN